MAFQSFDFEHVWGRLFHKRVLHTKFDIYNLYYYHWVDTSAGGQLVPEGIIHQVVSVLTLTWFIRFFYYWNFQFLKILIIIKTEVLLPLAWVTLANFGYSVYALWFSSSQRPLNYLAFQSFNFERTWWRLLQKRVECTKLLMKVIAETCRGH